MEKSFDHNKRLKKIARERLIPHGMIQEGNSRTFLYDNGWWTIIIEFQPSSWSKGSFLNIGVDFSFFPRDYFAFTYGHREKEFEEAEDENQFDRLINEYCDFTIKKVDELKIKFKDVWTANNTFKKQANNDPWDNFILGVLYGLCGDLSNAKRYLQKVNNKKCEEDFEFERQKLVSEMLTWLNNDDIFLINIKKLINKARQLKKLAPVNLDNIRERKIFPTNGIASAGVNEKKKNLWKSIRRWFGIAK